MTFLKSFAAATVVFASAMLLNQSTQVGACKCPVRDLCVDFEEADVVVRGTAVSRSDALGVPDDVTYTIDRLTFYKGDPGLEKGEGLTFSTAGNTAACGIVMPIKDEFILGLYRASTNSHGTELDGKLTVSSCKLARAWKHVSDEDKARLEEGECEDDPCNGTCSDFQECLPYEGSIYYRRNKYYCVDTCNPSPCSADEVCSLVPPRRCYRGPCNPRAVCSTSNNAPPVTPTPRPVTAPRRNPRWPEDEQQHRA